MKTQPTEGRAFARWQATCLKKKTFLTDHEARREMLKLLCAVRLGQAEKRFGVLEVYKCRYCPGFHFGNRPTEAPNWGAAKTPMESS